MFMCHIFVEIFMQFPMWFPTKILLIPRVEKQADFHASLWEATVVKVNVVPYIDIMMDEPSSYLFHFSSYLQLSYIWYAVLCSTDPMMFKVLFFSGLWEGQTL